MIKERRCKVVGMKLENDLTIRQFLYDFGFEICAEDDGFADSQTPAGLRKYLPAVRVHMLIQCGLYTGLSPRSMKPGGNNFCIVHYQQIARF